MNLFGRNLRILLGHLYTHNLKDYIMVQGFEIDQQKALQKLKKVVTMIAGNMPRLSNNKF